jgi:outer membrane protein assembly factor BamE (lipoprotein component of BamABCDE complex)
MEGVNPPVHPHLQVGSAIQRLHENAGIGVVVFLAGQEQVLIVLGTPSTVATVSGEAFYYISQRSERPVAFMPQSVVDQRVIAVYFDKSRRVERLANYGLRDGKLFDYVTRTTPTGGKDVGYLNAVFRLF